MLSKPSLAKIYLYQFLSLGLYFFYWCARSRADINRSAGHKLIPTTWLLALPAGNYYWMWQYADALEQVSYRRVKAGNTFLLYLIITALWYVAYDSVGQPVMHRGNHVSIVFAIILIAVFAVIEIAGLAFFCATIQKKINVITANQPASPAG